MVAGIAQDFREEMHEHSTECGQTGAHDGDLGLQDRPMNDGLELFCTSELVGIVKGRGAGTNQ